MSKDCFFQIATFPNEVGYGIAVIDSGDVLMNDGTFVKSSRGVVCRGANEFDSAQVRLVVGLAASKCGQKGVMDHMPQKPGQKSLLIFEILRIRPAPPRVSM